MCNFTNGIKDITIIQERNTLNDELGYRAYINGIEDAWICTDLLDSFLEYNLGTFWQKSDLVPNPK